MSRNSFAFVQFTPSTLKVFKDLFEKRRATEGQLLKYFGSFISVSRFIAR
jgi:hypothetical protein